MTTLQTLPTPYDAAAFTPRPPFPLFTLLTIPYMCWCWCSQAYWAGLIPIVTGFTTPTPAKDLLPGVPTPAHITNFTRFPRVTLGEPQQQKPAAKSPSMLVHIAVPWLLFFALLAFVLTRGFDSAEL